MEPIEAARTAARHAVVAQRRADQARISRDGAIVAAVRAGASVPLLAAATGLSKSAIRKVTDAATESDEAQ